MDRKENRRNGFSPFSFVHRNGYITTPLPLYSYAHSIRAFRGNAPTKPRSHPPPLQRTWTNERTDGWMDGRTAFLKGHFVPLSRVFSLAGRAMSSLGAAGGGGRRVKGRRKRNEPRQGRGEREGGRERERSTRGVLQPAYID